MAVLTSLWMCIAPTVVRVANANPSPVILPASGDESADDLADASDATETKTSETEDAAFAILEENIAQISSALIELLHAPCPRPNIANAIIISGLALMQANPGAGALVLTAGGAAADRPIPVGDVIVEF